MNKLMQNWYGFLDHTERVAKTSSQNKDTDSSRAIARNKLKKQ